MNRKDNAIGQTIKTRREERQLSLGQLASDADVSKSYLWKLESGEGEVRPSGRTLYRIAGALGTTMSDLLEREVLPDEPEDLPASLEEFAATEELSPQDRRMLAQINFRGRRPETVDDWAFLWNAIQRSVPARPQRRARNTSDDSATKRQR
jgi:transcriptional regulator with XRE-family HTH domain